MINHSGSAHVSGKSVWPLSLIAQGITSHDLQEINEVLSILESTTNYTYFMHESFNIDEPSLFTREWFSWANSFTIGAIEKVGIIRAEYKTPRVVCNDVLWIMRRAVF